MRICVVLLMLKKQQWESISNIRYFRKYEMSACERIPINQTNSQLKTLNTRVLYELH